MSHVEIRKQARETSITSSGKYFTRVPDRALHHRLFSKIGDSKDKYIQFDSYSFVNMPSGRIQITIVDYHVGSAMSVSLL